MPTSQVLRRFVILAWAVAVAVAGGIAVAPTFADEAVGLFELVAAKTQRVRSLLAGTQQPDTWWRYDAPEGKVFLVVLMEVKPIYADDPVTGGQSARMQREAVFVETANGKTGAVGSLYPSGALVPLDSNFMIQHFDGIPPTMFVDFVFVVPESEKQATVRAGDIRLEAKLDDPVLPRFDWRDAMNVTIVRAEKIEPPVRPAGIYDDLANRDHLWQIRYGEAETALVAVTFRVEPKRGNAVAQPDSFVIDLLDFRLGYGRQTHVRGICSTPEPGYAYDLGSDTDSFERGADGKLEAKEFTFVYPLYEPATKATLLYREAPIGEIEIADVAESP